MIVRNFHKSDYEHILSWWKIAGESCPPIGMMPEDSHFVVELNSIPVMSLGAFLTNSEAAYIENFIASPTLEKTERNELSQMLSDHVIKFVKDKGYKYIVCFAYKEKLIERYKHIAGMKTALSNVTMLAREI